ncbi:MAG: STAS domain-containing protein [Bacteroidia bacterium]|nr:STAS domain-containing protein [Bacteroidia bacterium]MCZ2277320.1 STAS domain-containing protein [Bacteroidia bacterium]
MEFDYKIRRHDNYCTLHLSGNLMERSQAARLLDEIQKIEPERNRFFILNLSDFKYMNSTGLSVLLNILTTARKNGGEAIICNISDKVKSLLMVTRLTDIFTVTDTEESAAAAFIQEA